MAHVRVVLREDVNHLGTAGELVRVRAGYARNFLLPRGKAALATAYRQMLVSPDLTREQAVRILI